MKNLNLCKILIVSALFMAYATANAQENFMYCAYINGIWGKWETSYLFSYPSTTDYGLFSVTKEKSLGGGTVLSGSYDDFYVYQENNHPSDYIFRVKINNFYIDRDKKSRKNHLKNNLWYEFSGTIECCFSSVPENAIYLDASQSARYNKPSIKMATIKIAPYKNRPECYNIFFDNSGIGIQLIDD